MLLSIGGNMQLADERHARAWHHLSFQCELIRSKAQVERWDSIFESNYYQEIAMRNAYRHAHTQEERRPNKAVRTYHRAASSEWICITSGECELYMCWLQYEDRIIIAVPIYIHMDIAFAQGIRRLYGFWWETSLPADLGSLGANLLGEVCHFFRYHPEYTPQYLFAYPISPFCNNLVALLRERGVACCKHTDTLLPCTTVYNTTKPTWLRHTYACGNHLLAIVREDGRRKDLGVFVKNNRRIWNVVEQSWSTNQWRKSVGPPKQFAPYTFLRGMYGGDFYVIIDAESMADRFAYAAQTQGPSRYPDFPRGPPLMDDEEAWEDEHIPLEAVGEKVFKRLVDVVDNSHGAVRMGGLNAQIVIRMLMDCN